jgi:TrmH family RNA methyltransferase
MDISRNDLKKFSSLKRKKKRHEHDLFVVEGEKICSELHKSNLEIVITLATSELKSIYPEYTMCSQKDLSRISSLKSPSNVLAICKIPKNEINLKNKKPLIFLDDISDPGNLGTIIRTLDWFGFKEVFCSKETVDSYNNKTVMASMGSIFRIQTHYIEFIELQKLFPNHDLYRTSIKGKNIEDLEIKPNSIIVIGNESIGVSDKLKKIIPNTLTITGKGQAESLNVSVASGIILNELVKKINLQK